MGAHVLTDHGCMTDAEGEVDSFAHGGVCTEVIVVYYIG
jgi:hypothetical protein